MRAEKNNRAPAFDTNATYLLPLHTRAQRFAARVRVSDDESCVLQRTENHKTDL